MLLKIFVCEFITGGGLCCDPLSQSLAIEGALMRDALLNDLSQIEDVQITTTWDARLQPPLLSQHAITIEWQADIWSIWNNCIAHADAVWIIAPETSGMLLRLTQMVGNQGKILLGCEASAVDICGRKFSTYQALQEANIQTVPTVLLDQWETLAATKWVCKPDDGVGCDDTVYFESADFLLDWMQTRKLSHIIQPYQAGVTASICMLCHQGQAWLLSCNQQLIEHNTGQFVYRGSIVNGMLDHWSAFERIAQQVANAISGLQGYVGIDLIVHQGSYWVLEINPRLTSSYIGLSQAIQSNAAQLVIQLLYQPQLFKMPNIERNVVEVKLPTEAKA